MALQHVSGKNVGNVKLYALSTCPWCKLTKKLFDEKGIDYYFCDVDLLQGEERTKTMSEVRKWNPAGSFPTIVINDSKAIIGFREQELKDTLKI